MSCIHISQILFQKFPKTYRTPCGEKQRIEYLPRIDLKEFVQITKKSQSN